MVVKLKVSIRFDFFDPDEGGDHSVQAVAVECYGWTDALHKAVEKMEMVIHGPRVELERITIEIQDPRYELLGEQYPYRAEEGE